MSEDYYFPQGREIHPRVDASLAGHPHVAQCTSCGGYYDHSGGGWLINVCGPCMRRNSDKPPRYITVNGVIRPNPDYKEEPDA